LKKILTTNSNGFALISVDVLHGDVDRLFHYAISPDMDVGIGRRVFVPFGNRNKPILGYVIDIADTPPPDIDSKKIKEIVSVPDNFPVLTPETLQLAQWMKDKYYCTLAAALRCITPTAKADGKFPGTRNMPKDIAPNPPAAVTLTTAQDAAVNRILDGATKPFLLHGVTGSGKTEVYIRAIQHTLSQNRQAIVLVPEIALTPQMVSLFTAHFGSRVAVTHSRLTQGERFQIWRRALDGEISLVIGPRSAVFAPFASVGLIVIDEEHEHTYHSETTPKYDARAVAVQRAKLCGATVILGSATPSLESYHKAQENEYQLIELPERVNKTSPTVTVLDMRNEARAGNTSLFAAELQQALRETVENGRQAILFLNRRGHSSFVSCRWCGFVLACGQCRVNHTYHADKNRMLCHYCGAGAALPSLCPACNSKHIKLYGMGTQKIEEEVQSLLPTARVLRMDMDTTRGKFGHGKILDIFRRGEADVLIGTQMVAKGLDFPKVTLVGVVAADLSLHTGDFRSAEHTFQLLTQVAGRAGRALLTEDTGRVFLQTYSPEHYAIGLAQEADYKNFFVHEMAIRRAMVYPPFSYVFSLMFAGPDEKKIIVALQKLQAIMEYVSQKDGRGRFALIGISPAFVSKIKKQFRWKLLLKSTEEEALKNFVLYCIKKLKENDPLTGITVHLTLNPIVME